jgi:hypothetical protein
LHGHRTDRVLDGTDQEARRAAKEANAQREMPGPGDWQVVLKGRPNYFHAPSGYLFGMEFNEYGGTQGYYYRQLLGPDKRGSIEMGPPVLWNRKKVEPRQ